MIKRLNASAVIYKSYLLQGVMPFLNQQNGLAVASIFRPVTADLKANLKQDKEALLDFLRAGHCTQNLLLTYSQHDRRKITGEFLERLAIICEDREPTQQEILLASASIIWNFSKFRQRFTAEKNSPSLATKRKMWQKHRQQLNL